MASRAASLLRLRLLRLRPPLPAAVPRPAAPSRAAHAIPRPPRGPGPGPDAQPSSSPARPSAQPPSSSARPSARPSPSPSDPDPPLRGQDARRPPPDPAYYQLSFTCVPCAHRSHHNVSKQAYHHGSILITCPGCRNRHVISDHLNIFGDRKVTVEDLMREKGRLVKRGTLGEDGDIEFWPDDPPADNKTAE